MHILSRKMGTEINMKISKKPINDLKNVFNINMKGYLDIC